MAMTVRTNLSAIQSAGVLARTNTALSKSLLRISSGQRITSAADDAARLGVAVDLQTGDRSVRQAMRNTNDGISLIQTAESASDAVTSMLQRMRELAVQGASETITSTERSYVDEEFQELLSEIDRVAASTEFSGLNVSDGTTTALQVQVGITSSATNSQITLRLGDLTANSGLGVSALAITSASAALTALDALDTAINSVNGYRAQLGAVQNRMESSLNHSQAYSEALSAGYSSAMDLDFAEETANLTRNQIMQQAGISAVAQAKNINQGVIALLS
jgi:flagellin